MWIEFANQTVNLDKIVSVSYLPEDQSNLYRNTGATIYLHTDPMGGFVFSEYFQDGSEGKERYEYIKNVLKVY